MVDVEGAAAREQPPEHDAKPGRLCLQPTGDRGFESCSLQRGVHCYPDSLDQGLQLRSRQPGAYGRAPSASTAVGGNHRNDRYAVPPQGLLGKHTHFTRSQTSVAPISLPMNGLTKGVVLYCRRSPLTSKNRVCSVPVNAWFHETSGYWISLSPSVLYLPAEANIVR